MAEREGFEPPELALNGFQDRRLKPLGHLSGIDWRLLIAVLDFTIRIPQAPIRNYEFRSLLTIRSAPPMYGLSTSGITMLPSGS